jgi:selenocysteine lyase/cysteine desulfurase
MMIDWDKIRRDFPITKNSAYFQSAAMSPIPTPVFDALLKEYQKLHLNGDIKWMDDLERFKSLCANLAESMNTEPNNVTFVPNTSTAMSLVALSLKDQIKKPFNIVSMKDEFPASTIGFEYLKIEMNYVEPTEGRYPIDSIIEMIDEQTVAVVTSQIQYATGFHQDLLALGRELRQRGVLFIANSTQAFPYFPVDVKGSNIDVLSASLHKWGLTGHVGSMFFTSPSFRERFPSPWAGWLSVDTNGKSIIHTSKNTPFRLHQSAHCYDFGTFNLQPLLAFQKALDYIQGIGLQNIQQRVLELTDYLIRGLKDLSITIISPISRKEERSAIVSFTLDDKNENCVKKFAENKIYVTLRDGKIRVSVNIFNNFVDIDRLLEVLRDLSI